MSKSGNKLGTLWHAISPTFTITPFLWIKKNFAHISLISTNLQKVAVTKAIRIEAFRSYVIFLWCGYKGLVVFSRNKGWLNVKYFYIQARGELSTHGLYGMPRDSFSKY